MSVIVYIGRKLEKLRKSPNYHTRSSLFQHTAVQTVWSLLVLGVIFKLSFPAFSDCTRFPMKNWLLKQTVKAKPVSYHLYAARTHIHVHSLGTVSLKNSRQYFTTTENFWMCYCFHIVSEHFKQSDKLVHLQRSESPKCLLFIQIGYWGEWKFLNSCQNI